MGRVRRIAAPADGARMIADHEGRVRQIEAQQVSGGSSPVGELAQFYGSFVPGDNWNTSNASHMSADNGSDRPLTVSSLSRVRWEVVTGGAGYVPAMVTLTGDVDLSGVDVGANSWWNAYLGQFSDPFFPNGLGGVSRPVPAVQTTGSYFMMPARASVLGSPPTIVGQASEGGLYGSVNFVFHLTARVTIDTTAT